MTGIITALVVSLPFIFIGLALLVAVIRAERKDLPKMINALARSVSSHPKRLGAGSGGSREPPPSAVAGHVRPVVLVPG